MNEKESFGIRLPKKQPEAKTLITVHRFTKLPVSDIKTKITNGEYIIQCDETDDEGIKAIVNLFNELKSIGVKGRLYEGGKSASIDDLLDTLDLYDALDENMDDID